MKTFLLFLVAPSNKVCYNSGKVSDQKHENTAELQYARVRKERHIMELSYQSTRGGETGVTASQAILKGLADDFGLNGIFWAVPIADLGAFVITIFCFIKAIKKLK